VPENGKTQTINSDLYKHLHDFTLNIFYCQANKQTMDQTQAINLRGLDVFSVT